MGKRKDLARLLGVFVALAVMAGIASSYTQSQQTSICNVIDQYVADGTLTQPGGAGTALKISRWDRIPSLVSDLKALGITGSGCFECPAHDYRVCIAMGTGNRAATGDSGADIVIAITFDSTGPTDAGKATADAQGCPGASAIAAGGNGHNPQNGGNSESAGGDAEAKAAGTGDAYASGGDGGGGRNGAKDGGQATATTGNGESRARGGAGGDPHDNNAAGGSAGKASASSTNADGSRNTNTNEGAKGSPGTPGKHGTAPTAHSSHGSGTGGTPSSRENNQ